jgi:streptomycin 6-kinase
VTALPGRVTALADRWQLQVGGAFEPGGQRSWVAPVRTAAGDDLVLKLGWLHPEALHEADALRIWGGNGAVRLHRAEQVGDTAALLLERCRPGLPLERAEEHEQDLVIANLLRRLWIHPPPGHPFRPLSTMCRQWATEFEQALGQSPDVLDPGLARTGLILLRELPTTATDAVVLCTDLHAENVLAAQREPWLAIDPKPYFGDRTFDPVQHMINCEDRLLADPNRLVRRIAHLLDLDVNRLRLWLFARCVQESSTNPHSARSPHASHRKTRTPAITTVNAGRAQLLDQLRRRSRQAAIDAAQHGAERAAFVPMVVDGPLANARGSTSEHDRRPAALLVLQSDGAPFKVVRASGAHRNLGVCTEPNDVDLGELSGAAPALRRRGFGGGLFGLRCHESRLSTCYRWVGPSRLAASRAAATSGAKSPRSGPSGASTTFTTSPPAHIHDSMAVPAR